MIPNKRREQYASNFKLIPAKQLSDSYRDCPGVMPRGVPGILLLNPQGDLKSVGVHNHYSSLGFVGFDPGSTIYRESGSQCISHLTLFTHSFPDTGLVPATYKLAMHDLPITGADVSQPTCMQAQADQHGGYVILSSMLDFPSSTDDNIFVASMSNT